MISPRKLVTFSLIGIVIGALPLTLFLRSLHEKAYSLDLQELHKLEAASIIYDRHGNEMGRDFLVQNRLPVKLDQVPKPLIRALVAVEDSRFFEHKGVDWVGVARAVLLNFKAGRKTQGASTITQQLGRQTFDLMERSYRRKLTEAFLANRIEKEFSKEEILEHYLNRIFFGHGFHGVNAASYGYFGKHVSEVTIEESAMLCGLIKAPNILSPLKNRDKALGARNHVLQRMKVEGFLSSGDAELLKKRPIVTNTLTSISRSNHAFHHIRDEITRVLGKQRASEGGFRIFTTIDMHLQMKADRTLREQLAEVESREDYAHQTYDQYIAMRRDLLKAGKKVPAPGYLQGALLAVDNDDGGVIAMVGGRNFAHFQFNCATQARRPAGSAFTPFVYAKAFESGMFPGTIVADKMMDNKFVQIGGADGLVAEWAVESSEQQWLGDITARRALELSKNAATVRLGLRVGLDTFLEFVKLAGIRSELRGYNSSFLGSSEVTLAELCKAYTIFPNGGLRPEDLYVIREIQTGDGMAIYTAKGEDRDMVDVVDEFAAYQTHSCLEGVLTDGTASEIHDLGLEAFPSVGGKTGTAYNYTDTWFMGYNSRITCGVWSGFVNSKTIYPQAYSKDIALPIWTDFMNASSRSFTADFIEPPETGTRIEICTVSGQLATDACYEQMEGEQRYERTAVLELIRPDFHLTGACQIHSPESELEDLRRQTESIMSNGSLSLYSTNTGPKRVLVRSATVIGLDPYNSYKTPIASQVKKEEPIGGDDKPVKKEGPNGGDDKQVKKEEPIRGDDKPVKKEEPIGGDDKPVQKKATVVKEIVVENPKARVLLDIPQPIELVD
jgi:penicillin-binding protein 1A